MDNKTRRMCDIIDGVLSGKSHIITNGVFFTQDQVTMINELLKISIKIDPKRTYMIDWFNVYVKGRQILE
jgi:hypothetical protein